MRALDIMKVASAEPIVHKALVDTKFIGFTAPAAVPLGCESDRIGSLVVGKVAFVQAAVLAAQLGSKGR